jgi:hypothetical protein
MTEFDDVIQLLEDGRPQATDLELDKIKQRIRRGQAAAPSGRKQSMKSRLTIMAMVAFGLLFSTAGAGLAVSGNPTNNASVAQYGTPTPTPTPVSTTVAAEEEGGVLPAEESNNAPEGGVAPAEEESTQPTRQVEATAGSQLPFTGFAAIPVMLGGIALLTGGLVLRRRTRAE